VVGENVFPDTAVMIAQRNAAAQAAQAQMVAANSVNMARMEAERHASRGSFTTVPTASGQKVIGRQNQLGYSAPTVSYRGMTPNSIPVRQAMSQSPVFAPNVVIANQNKNQTTSSVDARFLGNRRYL
jgi:hypothetical protein